MTDNDPPSGEAAERLLKLRFDSGGRLAQQARGSSQHQKVALVLRCIECQGGARIKANALLLRRLVRKPKPSVGVSADCTLPLDTIAPIAARGN
jgi:hypothetical protein